MRVGVSIFCQNRGRHGGHGRRGGILDHYMTLINYKEAQSGRMCYTSNNGAQSNRMSIISEGIEGLVTKTLHTRT